MTILLAKTRVLAALAASMAMAFASLAATAPASAAQLEKCYGVSKAGQDDGSKDMEDVPGMSTIDYQGDAYKYVTKGTCVEITTPFGPGSLKPIPNRPPKGK